ncbi:CxxH/CxxC protein [bacterium LRH843]|nr:CxxH/CxxC protein [bacterium LRH843]
MYYACMEHIELALDMIVDEEEVAPIIDELTEENKLSTLCSFCKNKANYSVKAEF